MVRILKVNDLDDRKRVLLAQSELNRQTLKLELANIKFAAGLLKRRYSLYRAAVLSLGAAAPLAGFLLSRRWSGREGEGRGLLSKLRSGLSFVGALSPFLKKMRSAERPTGEA
jgi:hypothetical protein